MHTVGALGHLGLNSFTCQESHRGYNQECHCDCHLPLFIAQLAGGEKLWEGSVKGWGLCHLYSAN